MNHCFVYVSSPPVANREVDNSRLKCRVDGVKGNIKITKHDCITQGKLGYGNDTNVSSRMQYYK